jgi:epoxide hydrolase-like predicted phosphatase
MENYFETKVVLFDLGRVLMHIDFDAFPNGLGLTTPESRAPYDAPLKPFIRLYEEGKMTTEEFLDGLYAIFDCRFPQEQILESFNDIIVEDNTSILPFVNAVRSQYDVAILSNTCACHWDKVRHLSSVVKLFPHVFTSFELGVMKPDRRVYDAVCASLNVAPHEVLFIDDLAENVHGAVSAGMHGIIYTSAEQLEKDFSEKKWYRST